jgi:hypothetical protein
VCSRASIVGALGFAEAPLYRVYRSVVGVERVDEGKRGRAPICGTPSSLGPRGHQRRPRATIAARGCEAPRVDLVVWPRGEVATIRGRETIAARRHAPNPADGRAEHRRSPRQSRIIQDPPEESR